MISALYVSSGTDTKAITFTHPQFLARQIGAEVEPPKFFVYVDKDVDPGSGELSFDDGRTIIRTIEQEPFDVHGFPGQLARVRMESPELDSGTAADLRGDVGLLRVQADNEAFALAALEEEWSPSCFIGVCDGCGAFGGNTRCENQVLNLETSIPVRLRTPWWVTDHLPGSTAHGGDDPANGDEVNSTEPEFPARLRQRAFMSTNWRSRVSENIRLHGGARLFDVMLKGQVAMADYVRRGILYSPRANRKLR